ncbi:hypothetical protein ACLMJK_007440 [Lecanora helva]
MDDERALELPSPKRMRLEDTDPAKEGSIASEDFDDLYGTPPANLETPALPTQRDLTQDTCSSSAPQARSMQLPGLFPMGNASMAFDSPAASNRADHQLLRSGISHGGEQESTGSYGLGTEDPSDPKVSVEESSEQTGIFHPGDSLAPKSTTIGNDNQKVGDMAGDRATETLGSGEQVAKASGDLQMNGTQSPGSTDLVNDSAMADAGATVNNEQVLNDGDIVDSTKVPKEAPPMEARAAEAVEGNLLASADTDMSSEIKRSVTVAANFDELATSNKSNTEAEFELDSSPYESTSSSDSSTDTSSSDDSESDGAADDYEMLSPEEEARRLMAEDGGTEGKVTFGGPRTLNEKVDEIVPKPDVTITADMQIEELGCVDQLVDNLALIKANVSGEYQVLESGSVLCLEDRAVIGVVAETIGRVQQPYYSVCFTNAAAMSEAGVALETKIFYVTQLSTMVFTQPLQASKGTDASNLHDEEVGDDEIEFSDDEAEAEHKRQVKLQKKARYDAKHGQKEGFSLGPQSKPAKPKHHGHGHPNHTAERPPNELDLALNYDDAGQDSDDLYTPLSRPSNLHTMMAPPDGSPQNQTRGGNSRGRGRGDRGEGRGRHRGNRGDHGNRGTGRGGNNSQRGQRSSFDNNNRSTLPGLGNHNLPPRPPPQSNSYQPPPQSYSQHPLQQPHPAHSSSQPPSYQPYPSPNSSYHNQSYPQPYPQPQYPQAPYPQTDPYETYSHQQPYPQTQHYPPQQAPSPANIPPGAHINPNFFRQQQAHNQLPQWQQQQQYGQQPYPSQQYPQYQQQYSPGGNTATSPGPLATGAARRLQENMDLLNGLHGRGYAQR